MRTPLLCLALWLLPLIAACAPKDVWVRTSAARPPAVDTVALAPPALLREVPGALVRDPFLENLFVGNIRFSGGYVVLEELGQQVRSKEVVLEGEERWRTQALEWADGALRRAMPDCQVSSNRSDL